VAVIQAYFHLCAEDYLWSWRAFLTTATSGLYVFAYSVIFFSRKLHLRNTSSAFLFFGWSLVMSSLFGIFTGAVGYIATAVFVRKIFGSIKVD
jgi:transmembrane 9 superfamily protein 2/4